MHAPDDSLLNCMDVSGCRKNALLERELLPVGSPADGLVDFWDDPDVDAYDYIWVDSIEGEHPLFYGSHLYPKETVKELIHEGVLQVSRECISCAWRAEYRVSSDYLADAWHDLERCGGGKKMILGCIGLWLKQGRHSWYARRTNHEGDMPRPPTVKTFREDGSCLMMCPTQVVDNRTYLPMALLCLFDEAIHMHRARKLIARVPRLVPLGCMVDGLFFTGPVDAKEELEAICEKECRYPLTLGEVYQFKSTVTWKDVPKCEQQLQGLHRDQEKPIFDVAWRNFVEGRVGNWLHEEDETAATDDAVLESMIRDEFDYEAVREEILAINPKLDHFQILATMAALNNGLAGQGAMVLGAAGVGKSEVLRTLRKLFDKRGFKTRVCAYTHSATRLVGGETVARLLHFNTELKDTVFFVDEVGLLPLSTLGQMSRWVELGARFFMFGDFEGQFEAWQDLSLIHI